MIALNIDPMNETAEYTLDQLFPYNANMAATTASGNSDQLRTWDYETQSYRYFFMYNNGFNKTDVKNYHWVENLATKEIANIKLKPGDAVFYYAKKTDNSFSVPGQVPNEAVGVLKQGYNMLGAGFPAEWCPNDVGTEFWQNATFAKATAAGNADQIRTWDEVGQTFEYYFLYNNGFNKADVKNYKWVSNDASKTVLTKKLSVGAGFFYYKKNAGDVEFKPGLKL